MKYYFAFETTATACEYLGYGRPMCHSAD